MKIIKSIIFLADVDFFSLFKGRRVTFKGGFRSVCLSPEDDKVPKNLSIPHPLHYSFQNCYPSRVSCLDGLLITCTAF